MSDMGKLHNFYCSKAWVDLAYLLKIQRGGKCERCGFTAATKEEWPYLIAHHKIELTEENVDDPDISLNPDRVEIICMDCHNKDHRRFGHSKKVYIVWGAPCSGKSTLVRQAMRWGDIILDVDKLWEAITFQPKYLKPDNCRFNIFNVRDNLLGQIKMRYGQFYDAYVIGGYPEKYERERVAQSLGAELIYCESTEEECLERRIKSGRPVVWDDYIHRWFEDYRRSESCG